MQLRNEGGGGVAAEISRQCIVGEGGYDTLAYNVFCPYWAVTNKRGNIKGSTTRKYNGPVKL